MSAVLWLKLIFFMKHNNYVSGNLLQFRKLVPKKLLKCCNTQTSFPSTPYECYQTFFMNIILSRLLISH